MARLTDDLKVTHTLPWGEVTGYEIPDERDRFYLPMDEVPAEHRPKLAPDVDTSRVFLRWSLANGRAQSMLTQLPDGVTMAWIACGKCIHGWLVCKCPEGVHEAYAITWARRRAEDGWGDLAGATARRVEREAKATTPPAARKPSTGRTAATRAVRARGTSDGSTDEAPSLTLDEIEAGAAGAADRALASITGEAPSTTTGPRTGRPLKKKRARR